MQSVAHLMDSNSKCSRDDDIESFQAATGVVDTQTAKRFLDMGGYNLNEAVSLFYEFGGPPSVAFNEDHTQTETAAHEFTKYEQTPKRKPRVKVTSSKRGNKKPHIDNIIDDDGTIRKPEPAYDECLLPSSQITYHRDLMRKAVSQQEGKQKNKQGDSSTEEDESIGKFFTPSPNIVCAHPFEAAKVTAIDAGRWLLVNLQNDAVFQSHVLNRDVWRNEAVEEIINENFIFWQRNISSKEGQQCEEVYRVSKYPHIAIVDPRTSREVKILPAEKMCTANDAVCELIAFLEDERPRRFQNDSKVSEQKKSESENTKATTKSDANSFSKDTESNRTPKKPRTEFDIQNGKMELQNRIDSVTSVEDTMSNSATYNTMNPTLGDLHRQRMLRQQQRVVNSTSQ